MTKPFDAYVAQQERKAAELEASIRADERERIVAMLTEEYGEDYVDLGVVGQIVKLIKAEQALISG
jgi:hypothetical protein